MALQGPKSTLVLEKLFTSLPEKPNAVVQQEVEGDLFVIIKKTLTGEEGFILCYPSELKDKFLQKILDTDKEISPAKIGEQAREVLRIEAGIPVFGKDMDSKNILPETGLEHSCVSYNKGCYIGQEVFARIKTYGAPNLALISSVNDNPVPIVVTPVTSKPPAAISIPLPPLTNIPALAVIIPTESILLTSS